MNKQWSCIIRGWRVLFVNRLVDWASSSLLFHWHFFDILLFYTSYITGRRSCLSHCATSRKFAVSITDGVIGILHWHNPSGHTNGPEVDSASNRNGYQEYFLVGKGGRCAWLHVPIVLKSVNLNLLEPSETVQACNGFAFTLRADLSGVCLLYICNVWSWHLCISNKCCVVE